MTSNISGVGHTGPAFHNTGDVGGSKNVAGEWNGLAVSASDDPASLIADAAEELTFAASETVEKDVSERKKTSKDDKKITVVPPPEEAMGKLQQQMGERLAKLLAAVKKAMGNPAAFRQALEGFPDPTERHAALLWLEGQLKDQPSLAKMAASEREALEAERPEEVQAGYNLLGVEGDAETGTGTDLYRRTVLGHEGISGVIDAVIERGGTGDFLARVDYLRQAVGADLSAANPSTDKRELEAMNNDLYHLRALGNFTRDFGAGIDKLREEGGKPPLPEAGIDALRLLCKAKDERMVVLDGLKNILSLEGPKDPTYDVRALTQTFRLAHQLPGKLFTDQDSRQRLLDGVQKLLDAAVDLEEDLMAEGD